MDFRRIAARSDRPATNVMAAAHIAATVACRFWSRAPTMRFAVPSRLCLAGNAGFNGRDRPHLYGSRSQPGRVIRSRQGREP